MQIQSQSLKNLWPLQAKLNERAGFDTLSLGKAVAQADKNSTAKSDETFVKAGRALKNYIDALSDECRELQDCLSWKHWYREAKEGRQYELQDLQNARVEAVDMLFFLVSIFQLLGLEPDDVFRLYDKKLQINHRRQDEDRTQAEHGTHEHENRQVT